MESDTPNPEQRTPKRRCRRVSKVEPQDEPALDHESLIDEAFAELQAMSMEEWDALPLPSGLEDKPDDYFDGLWARAAEAAATKRAAKNPLKGDLSSPIDPSMQGGSQKIAKPEPSIGDQIGSQTNNLIPAIPPSTGSKHSAIS